MDRAPTIDTGIRGVVLSDPEVIAVFPEMSATILPHAQEIRLFRGDSLDIGVQLQNDGDPPDVVQLGNSVMRFAAKQGHGLVPSSLRVRQLQGNEASLVVKSSYDPDQIEFVSEGAGRAIIHISAEDTSLLPAVPAMWDLELTAPREEVDLPSGVVSFFSDDDTVVSLSPALDWTKLRLRPGDIFRAQGRTVLIRSVLSSQHLRLDWTGWTTDARSTEDTSDGAISLYRGKTKTVAYGAFVVLGDVVR